MVHGDMNISFFNGVSGLIAAQQGLDTLAHNMSNVNTDGFKGSQATFRDLLYTEMDTNGETKHTTGHGVAASSNLMFTQGSPRLTNRPLDFAIVGEGLFAVRRGGEIEYTRSGSFHIGIEGKKAYLVSNDGAYVLDKRGRNIPLTKKSGTDIYELEGLAEKIGVYQFDNPFGLEQTSNMSFRPTELSGKAYISKKGQPYDLLQSAVESSNVELTDEMANLITIQKSYQLNAKMVQTADQIQEIVNNLR